MNENWKSFENEMPLIESEIILFQTIDKISWTAKVNSYNENYIYVFIYYKKSKTGAYVDLSTNNSGLYKWKYV